MSARPEVVEAVEKARAGACVTLVGRNAGQIRRMREEVRGLAPEALHGAACSVFHRAGKIAFAVEGDPYADVDFGGVK